MADVKNYGQKGVADDLQIGKRGPRIIKDGSGDLLIRDKDNSAYVNVKVLDPVDAQDAATKAYVDTQLDQGYQDETLDETASQNIGVAIPAGSFVQRVKLEILTPYDTGATISIGDGTNTYMTIDENDAELAGIYIADLPGGVVVAGGGQLVATVGGAPFAGSAKVHVNYDTPTP